MKKLVKLHINSERIIKNEELLILKGGYGDCMCFCHSVMGDPLGSIYADTGLCVMMCQYAFGISATGYCNS